IFNCNIVAGFPSWIKVHEVPVPTLHAETACGPIPLIEPFFLTGGSADGGDFSISSVSVQCSPRGSGKGLDSAVRQDYAGDGGTICGGESLQSDSSREG